MATKKTAPPVGYSGKAVFQKLGLSPGDRLVLVGAPKEYFTWLGLPARELEVATRAGKEEPFVHLFLKSALTLDADLDRIAASVARTGVLWVSWRKAKADGIGDREIRAWALQREWVDVKVCAVSAEWSGLKLVVRRDLR